MKRILLVIMTLSWFCSCAGDKKSLYQQYAFLLERSFDFVDADSHRQSFLEKLNYYLKNYKHPFEYRKTDTFDFIHGRLESVILHPILLNNKEDKALVMVLTRGKTIDGKRIEEINFVSAIKSSMGWMFKVNNVSTLSYSYFEDHPTASDQELALRALKQIISDGYFRGNQVDQISDDFFEKSDWYVR